LTLNYFVEFKVETNNSLTFSTLLDPRFKNKLFSDIENVKVMTKKLLEEVVACEKEKRKKGNNQTSLVCSDHEKENPPTKKQKVHLLFSLEILFYVLKMK